MRLAGHTYSFRDRPLGKALDGLTGLGLELVEVWLGHAEAGAPAVAKALAARNLTAVAVSAGGFYEAASTASARAFELALAIEAPVVVACVSPGLLTAVCDALPQGLTLCVENHWDQPLATPREIRRALVGEPRAAACLDTGHAILAGIRPERFAASLKGRLGHVHLKDACFPSKLERAIGRRLRRRLPFRPQPVFPGRGALGVDTLHSALVGGGYRGVVTVEHEGREAGAALEELVKRWHALGSDRP